MDGTKLKATVENYARALILVAIGLLLLSSAAMAAGGKAGAQRTRNAVPSAEVGGEVPYSPKLGPPVGTDPTAACRPATDERASCLSLVQPLGESEQPIGRIRQRRPASAGAHDRPGSLNPACFTGIYPFCGSGAHHGLSPQDLQSAYRLPIGNGTGQTIAIVDAFDNPNAEEDLAVYRETYGLSPCTTANGCFKKVDQRGGNAYPAPNVGWAMETSLDLDMVSAACPKCHILLVEGDDDHLESLSLAVETAVELGADAVSNSYGLPEGFLSEGSFIEGLSEFYVQPGTPLFVSSGDSGFNNEEIFTEYGCFEASLCGASWPSSLATTISVGGTNLTPEGSSGRGWREEVWNGAGSGCALFVAKPSWQTDTGCAGRTDADIGGIADSATPVSVYNTFVTNLRTPGWSLVGGTSAAAPLAAGAFALESETRRAEGVQGIYSHPGEWNDVVGGSNWFWKPCSPSYLCTGVEGYDGSTGIGTPKGGASATPPAAVTETATGVTNSAATLNATVNPEAASATYYFQYGTTTSYGSKAPTTATSISGYTQPQPVSQAISGLSASARYHYRIVAQSAGGTTYGLDQTFSTLPKIHGTNISSLGSTEGKVQSPSDSAVDQNGNIWVTDTNNNRLELFTPNGKFIKTCGSSGSGFTEGGKPQLSHPTGIAIDRVFHDLYVADTGNNRILIIRSEECRTFEYLGQPRIWEEPNEYPEAAKLLEPKGLAFAPDNGGEVLLVADTGHNRVAAYGWLFQYGFLGSYGEKGANNGQFNAPTDVIPAGESAFDTHEYLVVDSGNNRIQRLKEEQEIEEHGYITESHFSFVSKFGEAGTGNGQLSSPTGIAFDRTSNEYAVSDTGNGRVQQFLPNGTYAGQFGTKGFGEASLATPKGLSAADNGAIYVADSEGNRISPWLPGGTAAPPIATTSTATSVTTTGATLRGTVNPKGGATTYRFQYGTTDDYGTTIPFPGESAGSGTTEVTKTKEITGLHGGTTYHFRIIASSEGGTSYGADMTFTTPAVAPSTKTLYPDVERKVRYTVELRGTVNPRGAATQVYFEYGETAGYGTKTASQELPSGTADTRVDLEVPLKPVTEYHYRVVAVNSIGTTYGQDVAFKNSRRGTAEAATDVSATYATLNATIDPEGQKTFYQFEYDDQGTYSLKAPEPEVVAGSGNSYVHVSQKITGLKPDTKYYVRIMTEEQSGMHNMFDYVEFTTLPDLALCKVSEAPCPETNRYVSGSKLSAALKPGTTLTLKAPGGTTVNSCTSSSLEEEVTSPGGPGEAAAASVSSASFSGCKGTLTAESLAWGSEITHAGVSTSATQTFSNVALKTVTSGVTCSYGGKVGFNLNGGSSAEMAANEVALAKQSGGLLCPATLNLTATYVFSSPLYFTWSVPLGSTVLCGSNSEICPEANRYPAGTKLSASIKSGTTFAIKLSDGSTLNSCTGGSLTGEVTGAGGANQAATVDISAASFSGCGGSMAAEGLSWHSEINRTLGLGTGTQTFPNLKVNTTAFGVTCGYGGKVGFQVKGGSPAELVAVSVPVTKLSGGILCPSNALLTASYVLGSPASFFVSRPG